MSSPLRILIVEDSVSDAKLLVQELRQSGLAVEFERVETPDAMRAALATAEWDAITCDWSMPKFSAMQALEVLRQTEIELPFIVVSGTIGEEVAVEAMRAGADDYVLKDKLGRLVPALQREIREYARRAAHRRSEVQTHALLESALDAIIGMDANGVTTEFNPAAQRMFGYTREEAIGTLLCDLIVPAESRAAHTEGLRRYVETGERRILDKRVEVMAVRRDGTAFPVERAVVRVGSESPPVFIAFVRDISERRHTESALRESEARFRRLAESGIIGITIADVHGTIHEANDAYLKMIGYTRDELTHGGVRWLDLTPPDLVERAQRAAQQLVETGIAPAWETEHFRKDGTRIPLLVGVAMLEYPKCIAFSADLTERRLAETGRSHAEEALRQSEEQLRQAQKMEAVGRLAGGVAHDFNNVLSVILSYSELILGDLKGTDPLRSDIEEIRTAASRAAGLTGQLLMFSRQQVVAPQVLDLNDVLGGLEKMLQRMVGEDVELVYVRGKFVGHIKADPSHIEQVILNLVVNARDAMPTGGQLTIETACVELDEHYAQSHVPARPGPYVMLAVTDTGCGIDKAIQSRIFEPFFTTKEQGKGTGLGLSTVFGIVQQSGGTIWIYSERDKGTTFKVYLPRVDAELDVVRATAAPTTLRGTETILLVEDEEQVRMIVLNVLRRQGYRVIAAQHAGEALLLCERHPQKIDLLVTDVVMPQMSGPELAKRLQAERPEMKVLCMSGYTDDSIVRHGVLETGVAFLQKPITPGTLARKVREVLDNSAPSVPRRDPQTEGS
ncbi:MAG TPA: PAS domain S-box protein [Polyangiaceae bacterium]